MSFSSLIGNERIKELLRRAVRQDRIHQGLIFAGPAGVGKHRFALALGKALNCRRPADGDSCGLCDQCIKIEAREHIDVETVVPDGQFIKVDQMRDMAEKANFRPFDGRRRVYILDDADRLNANAANSILKVLEEPPVTTQLILVTAKPYSLLETIRSRCQMLSFAPLSGAELEAYLRENQRRPEEETRLLARLARGSIGRALEIDLGVYREQRVTMLELVESALVSRDTLKLMQAAEQIAKKDRDEFERHVDALLVLLADLFRVKLSAPPNLLTNADIAPRLVEIAETVLIEQITDWVERLEVLMQGLVRNVNRRLAMEGMLLALF